jgi:hypothetical protein
MAPMKEKEWTLMFYFASDTPLAPEIVSQLKSIKQAGFHSNVNVVAQFDPNPENAETHIFDINRINKIQANNANKIGFIGFTPNDPIVVNLMTDKLWRNDSTEGPIRQKVIESLRNRKNPATKTESAAETAGSAPERGFEFDPPEPPPLKSKRESEAPGESRPQQSVANFRLNPSNELSPEESLTSFLKWCRDNYPARHYILFILGHGVVVGNDTFLFDENAPVHSLMLKPLGKVLEQFKEDIKTRGGVKTAAEFELISLHSCSMSSLEVAFELQGTAKYLLASQSPSFVGSWPYRQILIRIFNYQDGIERGIEKVNVEGLLKNIFHYCSYNTYDFLVAGYSGDLCLCDLSKVPDTRDALYSLSAALIDGLSLEDAQAQKIVRERILLAHLDAQSYFNENYVDLFDFCFRLQQRFKTANQDQLPVKLQAITDACQKVMEVLEKGVEGKDDRLIVRSDFVGPTYQYSHGLSIYFPWKPVNSEFWPKEYNGYKFVESVADEKNSWSAFLAAYFNATRRRTRADEFTTTEAPGYENEAKPLTLSNALLEAFATGVFNNSGQLDNTNSKPGPDSSMGAGCDCQSIKNYPPFTREPQPGGVVDGKISVSRTALDDPTFTQNEKRPTFVLDGLM